jgi:hypothetical protein
LDTPIERDAVAYWLLFLDLFVGVAAAWIVIWCVLWAFKTLRGSRGVTPAGEDDPHVKRRCDACGSSWWGIPGYDKTTLGLKMRRQVRTSRRAHKRRSWNWTARQGWNRCPSCLSTEVRNSSEQDAGFSRPDSRRQRASQTHK